MGGTGTGDEVTQLSDAYEHPDTFDRDAILSTVFRDEYTRLVGLARVLLDRTGDAEECVQEAFAQAYAAWPRVRRQQHPLPYLRQSVVNLARGGLRRRQIARRAVLEPAATVDDADVRVLLDERQRAVVAAVRALPPRQRECIALRYFQDCSTAATAATLGISEGSVKTHLHRGLATLETALEDLR